MELHFVKMNPSGNLTVLITDPVQREQYSEVAQRIMRPESIGAEQVGFIQRTENGLRMEMMGGEFCGNASRCFAAWKQFLNPENQAENSIFLPGIPEHTKVNVSGAESPLDATAYAVGEKTYEVFLDIPLPREMKIVESVEFGHIAVVVFDGIVHIVLPDRKPEESDEEAAQAVLRKENLPDTAFGLMYYDQSAKRLVPYVVVNETDSRVWESSCGSGSCAVALWLALRSKCTEQTFRLMQPGGELIVSIAKEHGRLARISLGGPVRVETCGTVYI